MVHIIDATLSDDFCFMFSVLVLNIISVEIFPK